MGGILRDIFTMGARPIAMLNSLRFGPPTTPQNRRILAGVVAGIGGYGNAFGCPTVGGEVVFEPCYAGNPLVNAFCLGLVKTTDIFKGRADGVGNTVFYVGAKTGRDGIHGATMASAEFGEGSEEQRPTVQVGDPFMEKVLLEACLEVLKTGAVVGIQDMGAAGLSCSTSEMGARAGTGIEIDIQKVPMRETGHDRLRGHALRVAGAHAARGAEGPRAGDHRRLREVGPARREHRHRDRRAAAARLQPREARGRRAERGPHRRGPALRPAVGRVPKNPAAAEDVLALAAARRPRRRACSACSPRPPSRASAGSTASTTAPCARTPWWAPGSDAAVVRVKGTTKALAMKTDGNGRYGWLDPYEGARLAVAEACRNVVAAGSHAHRGHQLPQLRQPRAARGHGPARGRHPRHRRRLPRASSVPITGGNVSLYNETDGKAIYPTPVIGVVGLIEDAVEDCSPRGSRTRATWSSCSGRRTRSSAAASSCR